MIKSIVKFSQLEDRLDAEFYSPVYSDFVKKIKRINALPIGYFVKEFNTGFAPVEYKNFGVPILKVRNFHDGDISFDNTDFVDKEFFQKYPKALLSDEDIVLTTTGEGSIGKVDYYYDERKAGIVPEVTKISPNINRCDSGYLFAALSSRFGKGQFMRYVNRATGQTHLYFKDLKDNLLIPNISLKLQKKIGDLVRTSMRSRGLSEQKYQEAQELLNKYLGISEQPARYEKTFSILFSQLEDRFDAEYYQSKSLSSNNVFKDGFVKLGEIASIQMGKTPSKQSYTNSGIRILKVRDLTNKGVNWEEGNRAFVNTESWNGSEKGKVQENDILLISAAHQAYYIGKKVDVVFDIPSKYEKKMMAVAELLTIRSNNLINPFVLLWYLRTPIAYKQIQQQITGETSHLYPKDLNNLEVPKLLLKFKETKKIEDLTKESIMLKKESKQLLEKAKHEVERIIEQGGGDDSKS